MTDTLRWILQSQGISIVWYQKTCCFFRQSKRKTYFSLVYILLFSFRLKFDKISQFLKFHYSKFENFNTSSTWFMCQRTTDGWRFLNNIFAYRLILWNGTFVTNTNICLFLNQKMSYSFKYIKCFFND